MGRWPKDNPAALQAFYGNPANGEIERQLVPVVPPFKMYYEGKPVKAIRFHKRAAPALLAALNDIWEYYGRDQKKIDALGISKYAGAYNARKIAGSNKWSNHAFGAAIDLNAEENGFNTGHGTMPQPVVDAFKRQGARWGGDYKGRTDPMHFEFCDNGEAPVALVSQPEEDGDASDTAAPVENKPGLLAKVRNWLGSGFTIGGLAVYNWEALLVCGSFALVVFFIIYKIMGKQAIKSWITRHFW